MYSYLLSFVIFILICIIYYLYIINDKIVVYWFFKHGCPYSDNMEIEWSKVKNDMWYPHVEIKRIDISKKDNVEIIRNFAVEGAPHIIKIKSNGMRYNYEGELNSTAEQIIKWIIKT